MKISTLSFRGMAPRVTPRALPPEGAQQALNTKLLTGDLEPWNAPLITDQLSLAGEGPVRTIFKLSDIWLSWQQDVEVARGPILGDTDYRTYITGLDAPRFTTLSLANSTGAPPYPGQTRLLGVPPPVDAPIAVATIPPPEDSNITLVNPGAEAGNTSGWTVTTGTLDANENGDIPGLNAQTGTFFFGGGSAAVTEAFQSVDLASLGVIAGQGLSLTWWQASGANGSLGAMGLRFYDSGAALVAEVLAEELAISPANTWEQRTLAAQVPDGAVTVRLVQFYTRVGGGANDAYIDTIALSSIAFTNSFDGSSLSGWQTSPNEGSGNSFRRVEVSSAAGRPVPSFRFDADSRVPYFYRDFGADRSPQIVLQYDTLAISQRPGNDGFSVLYASAGGLGTGIAIGASGIAVYTFGSWDTVGANVQTLLAGAVDVATWFTVTLTCTQTSSTSANMVVRVINAATGEVLVDDVTVQIAVNGPMIGFKKSGNFAGRYNYVDNVTITVAAPDPQDDLETQYTSYVYTYVNDFGEESPPSPVSDTIQRNINASTIITTAGAYPTSYSEDYGITFKRIYRAVTGALGSEFLFVAEIPLATTTYEDTFEDSELGEPLESEDWDLPPSDLRYILALPNGIMVGASGNQLCFSVQNRPHAWPVGFRLATDTAITGLGNIDTSVVVGTESFVYTASGNSPDAYSMSKPGAPHSCLQHRSIAYLLRFGVIFAGPDGLMAARSATDVTNLTESIYTREQWQALRPETITAASHDDMYFFSVDEGSGGSLRTFMLDMRQTGAGLIELPWHATAMHASLIDDNLYMVLDELYDPCGEDPDNEPQPILLMHWDGNLIDDTGITTFDTVDPTAYEFLPSDDPAFSQVVSYVAGNPRIFGNSTQDLAIGTNVWQIEGKSKFASGQIGGVVAGKNYWPSLGAVVGTFRNDWVVFVRPDQIEIEWTGQVDEYIATFGPIYNEEFDWAVSDDGTTMRFFINGSLIHTENSASMDPVPPPVSPGSQISVLNVLQGFTGSAPNWSASFYRGQLDELRMFIGHALYTGSSYTLATEPFQIIDGVDPSAVYQFNAGAPLCYSFTGKLWLTPHPMAFHWVRVRAQDYNELTMTFYTDDGQELYTRVVTSNRAFRLPVRGDYNEIYWRAVGTSRVRSVEIADDVMELD